MLQIMFPLLDEAVTKEETGHWFTINLDLVQRKFKILDSSRDPKSLYVEYLCAPLIATIKKLWNKGFASVHSNRSNLDDFKVVYGKPPKQENK